MAVLWCIAAAEEHHGLLSDVALPMVLTAMADHVEDARVQENCCGFLFSLSSTVRVAGRGLRWAVHCTVLCCVVLHCFLWGHALEDFACASAWDPVR